MKTISNALILALFITIIHGFPQQKQDTPSSQIEDRTKDTLTQSKPLDRSQISTFPATVNIKKQDTVPHNKEVSASASADSYPKQGSIPQSYGDSRKTRDTSTVDSSKQQQHPAIRGTKPPATVDSNKPQNSGPQTLSQDSNSRKTRGVENSKHRDIEANHHQQPQPHQSRQPSHLTKDTPVSSNAPHPHPHPPPIVDTRNPKQH